MIETIPLHNKSWSLYNNFIDIIRFYYMMAVP
jgi:hypothetical protein